MRFGGGSIGGGRGIRIRTRTRTRVSRGRGVGLRMRGLHGGDVGVLVAVLNFGIYGYGHYFDKAYNGMRSGLGLGSLAEAVLDSGYHNE